MNLQEIRDQLIHELIYDLSNWDEVINNTNPGNYGIEDWDIAVPEQGFFVDIPSKTFSFKNVDFSAKLILGASKGDSSFIKNYRETANGKGTFEFTDKKKVSITDTEINIDLDVFK